MPRSALFVTALGAYGHLGLSALQTATAMRAKQLAPTASPFLDRDGDPIGMAVTRAIPRDVVGPSRMIALATAALREVGPKTGTLPLFVALPDAADRDPKPPEAFLEELALASEVSLAKDKCKVFRAGHAGFAAALAHAERELDLGDEALIGAVDSPFSAEAATRLAERGWIAKEGVDGARIPAEAAAFVRVSKRAWNSRARHRARLAAVEHEEASREVGSTLGKLLRRVARAPRGGGIAWLVPDLNGEPQRAEAFGAAASIARDLLDGAALDELVQHCGDTGAATGALLTVITLELLRIGAADAPNVTITTMSDRNETGVMVWDAPEIRDPPDGFAASIGAPRQHAALQGAARPATSAEQDHLIRMARACLDDIGSMGLLVGPSTEEEQADLTPFAQRLLDAFDALVALTVRGSGAPCISDLEVVLDGYDKASPPNPARRFATEFVRAHLAAPRRPATAARKRAR